MRAKHMHSARLTTPTFPPHGLEPAGFQKPWGGLPDAKRLPWMQYGAACTLSQRPTSAHAANRHAAEAKQLQMKRFIEDGVQALTTVMEHDLALRPLSAMDHSLAWMKKSPEVQLIYTLDAHVEAGSTSKGSNLSVASHLC